jgi:hypothetical protein
MNALPVQFLMRTEADIEDLVLPMARDNPRWGYTRIRRALHNLGHEIARNSIRAPASDFLTRGQTRIQPIVVEPARRPRDDEPYSDPLGLGQA